MSRRDVAFALEYENVAPSTCSTTAGAACDDGDTVDGDGCSASCQVEAGFTCTGLPSVCGQAPAAGCVGSPTCPSTATGNMPTPRYYARAIALADG